MNLELEYTLESSGQLERDKDYIEKWGGENENKLMGMMSRPHFRAGQSDTQV